MSQNIIWVVSNYDLKQFSKASTTLLLKHLKTNKMKSLNQKTVQILTVVLLLIGIQTNASAGDLIKGNGTVISQKRSLEKFHRIEIETFCNVTVNNGSMPMMELKTDENIAEKLNIRVEDGVLIVST